MGDEQELGHDASRDEGDLRDHDDSRAASDETDRRRAQQFSEQIDSVITEAEGVTQRAADQHEEKVARDHAAAERAAAVTEPDARSTTHPLPEARRASEAPEPPSANHPAAELRWLEVEQRMIARALDEAGIRYSTRTIDMIAYDATNRRAVEIALQAMDALYEGGEPS